METLLTIITSEASISIILAIFGAVWVYFKNSEFWKNKKEGDNKLLFTLAETAVEKVYLNYVKERKMSTESAPKGKLAEPEKTIARDMAADLVKKFAKERKLKIDISEDELKSLVSLAANKAKKAFSR